MLLGSCDLFLGHSGYAGPSLTGQGTKDLQVMGLMVTITLSYNHNSDNVLITGTKLRAKTEPERVFKKQP
jgi:hypothetical protein